MNGGQKDPSPEPPWLVGPPELDAGVSIVLFDLAVAFARIVATAAFRGIGGERRP